MARVEINGIDELEKRIKSTFGKVTKSKKMNEDIGEFVVGRIQAEARRGKPLNDSRSFPPLKETTKIIRDALASTNDTHSTFKVNRSNLTFSGQLIDAISFRVMKDGAIRLFVANTVRKRYKSPIDRQKVRRDVFKSIRSSTGANASRALKGARGATDRQEVKTNKEVDRDLRRRKFELYTAKGIESEPRILKRINNIVKKYVRRAIKVNFGS